MTRYEPAQRASKQTMSGSRTTMRCITVVAALLLALVVPSPAAHAQGQPTDHLFSDSAARTTRHRPAHMLTGLSAGTVRGGCGAEADENGNKIVDPPLEADVPVITPDRKSISFLDSLSSALRFRAQPSAPQPMAVPMAVPLAEDDFQESKAGIVTVPEITTAIAEGHSLFHIVMIYKKRMKHEPLCTVESIIKSLGESKIKTPATVVLWVYKKGEMIADHRSFFEQLDQELKLITDRKVVLAFQEVTVDGIFADTPFQEFYHNKTVAQLGRYGENNKVNALRLAIVWKYGGMYMDADMIYLRDPTALPMGLSTQVAVGKNKYNSAAFKLPAKHPLLMKCMLEFVNTYKGSKWGWQGPRLLTRVAFAHCPHEQDPKERKKVFDAHKKGKKRLSPVCDFESWSTKAAAHFLYVKWDAQHSVHDLYNREKKPKQKCLGSAPGCYNFKDHELKTYIGYHDPLVVLIHMWHQLTIEIDRGLCANLTEAEYMTLPAAKLREDRCPIVNNLMVFQPETKCDM